MDILIYNGPGTSSHLTSATYQYLQRHLGQRYAIRYCDASLLNTEPWARATKLLVLPGGRDLPYVSSLNSSILNKIRHYVESGGAYWGICAGAYFASSQIEFEVGTPLQVIGQRKLGFFDGLCRGATFPGFDYDSERGAQATMLDVMPLKGLDEMVIKDGLKMYFNGGGSFIGYKNLDNVKLIAKYQQVENEENEAAIILCDCKLGKALLMGVHPEYPTDVRHENEKLLKELREHEQKNDALMRYLFTHLGLVCNNTENAKKVELEEERLFLVSSTRLNDINKIISRIEKVSDENGIIEGYEQTIQVLKKNADPLNNDYLPLDLSITDGTNLPTNELYFKVEDYIKEYEKISNTRSLLIDEDNDPIYFGLPLFYSPTLISTQKLFNDHNKFQSGLKEGSICVATIQRGGKGRGKNTWVSNLGCLQHSFYFTHEQTKATSVVLLQYLYALAIIKALEVMGYGALEVRLKWPNDIYARKNKNQPWLKIGGILVNSNFMKGEFKIVIGCGINVSNSEPTLCINDLINEHNQLNTNSKLPSLTQEHFLANILNQFHQLYTEFIQKQDGFKPFLTTYYNTWLHSNQYIQLADHDHIYCKILGITSDFGMLEAIKVDPDTKKINPLDCPVFHLQPDGNSFDMLHGLIAKKKA